MNKLVDLLEKLVFGSRPLVIGFFAVVTLLMLWALTGLRLDVGFTKSLPMKHDYMQTYVQYRDDFGGANRVLIALVARDGNMFTPAFFNALKNATDEVFFIPGVDRARVSSLFTPDVRFSEVVEDGIAGGNVVPANFQPTPEGLEQVRKNILKSSYVGRLVANDFSGAIISAQLLEIDPTTGERLNYIQVAKLLEEKIRTVFDSDAIDVQTDITGPAVDVHMVGFAKVMGDLSEGARMVVVFFASTLVITTLLVYWFTQSWRITVIPIACAVIAVIWQLGLMTLLGLGIDPLGILVPFLIFAIGVSHGVQMVSAGRAEAFDGLDAEDAARAAFRKLLAPGIIALASDTIGFITILLIEIQIIQEMALTASTGVAVIILTNFILLPVLMSYVHYTDKYRQKLIKRARFLAPIWSNLSKVAERGPALIIIMIAVFLGLIGFWRGADIKIGDLHAGVPELRQDSRYNIDTEVITDKFSVGVDIISMIVETPPEGCIIYDVMSTIDDFAWHMENVEGVQSVITLSKIAKMFNAGWNEGSLKWRVLPKNQVSMVQSIQTIDTSSGLYNSNCTAMPVMVFTADHKAETISRVVAEAKKAGEMFGTDEVKFRLATGPVGVMAATNEVVEAAQFPILIGVFSAVILLCWLTFRSFRAVLCIVVPLALVSMLGYALMTTLEIGLKHTTLPVVALGVGIGVDYGIYIYGRFQSLLKEGLSIREAYLNTLRIAGNGVIFTGGTLAIGVATWIFSPLKFQADMGILLTFMFLVNMLGAIFLLPAMAAWLRPDKKYAKKAPE